MWFIVYLGFILGIEIITKIQIYIFNSTNTQSIYPLYVAGEFFFLLQVFLEALKAIRKYFILITIVTFCIFVEALILLFINNDASTGYGKIFSHLTIVCLSAFTLIKNLKNIEMANPFLIVYAALFLYYSASIFLFLLMNQLTNTTITIWSMNNVLASILYGCSLYSFYRLKKL
ncbi:hypothetical protein [Aquimarina aggregata]|uniref:hypothetical protein n=1 Tax=Aquimarina aggregata TaxID=1642818 RepID=UPI00248FAAB7|nr:hypothetical protein [Aquimarina aggregata]